MSEFIDLFERYGYRVEPLGKRMYIADNGEYCVPFLELMQSGYPVVSTISFSSRDKEYIKNRYNNSDTYNYDNVFYDYINGRLKIEPCGYRRLCNHDHSLFEVEDWLKWSSSSM